MRTQKIVAALAASALALGSVGSFAQSYLGKEQDEQRAREQAARGQGEPPAAVDGRRDSRGNDARGNPGRDNRAVEPRNDYRGADNRRDYRPDNRADYRGGSRNDYRDGRSAYRDGRSDYGDGRSWHRGDRLPPEYRSRQYVVEDWRGHHLSAPPRGYQWVQAGGDYVLVAIATGIIASILLNQ